ncbi:hypothetical protein CC86DRAFT_401726 [Ophiobolus disseminans]|uniref:DUF7730 domain-containing protein n=1 Tax=Ophiobolus disseminans TaxID=1469910 RepID=A0A6A7AEU2_9PLEO|nr:hypothetical protein CC86DRAFT_401726 [Ophiobolus disseminans]
MTSSKPNDTSDPKNTRETPLQAINTRNQQSSPLLRLPAELRNSIYHYVLGDHKIQIRGKPPKFWLFAYHSSGRMWDAKPFTQVMNLDLTLTCRQFRAELAPTFAFAHNTFIFLSVHCFVEYLKRLAPAQRESIAAIEFNLSRALFPNGLVDEARKLWDERGGLLPGLKYVMVREGDRVELWTRETVEEVFEKKAGKKGVEIEFERMQLGDSVQRSKP